VNHLKGRVLVASQFTEADFFIRYLAHEAGLEVKALAEDEAPDPERVNLIYAEDAFAGGDLFTAHVNAGGKDLAGAVVWGPEIDEILQETSGKTRLLVDNRNLLVVADVLVVNRPFAQANPKIVEGLVDGLLAGNDMVRTNPAAHLDMIARAFQWKTSEETRAQLAAVHFSNLPENRAFFSGAIDAAGSYGGIYQSAMLAYGSLINHSVPPERFLDLKLDAPLAAKYAHQKVSIQPIRSSGGRALEENPLLTRDIRFYFAPNSAVLESNPDNDKNYDSIKQLLQVAPGSTILLRGHVDNSLVPKFREEGGEPFVRQMALKAMELSRQRADAVRIELTRRYNLPATRIEIVGRGWEEPAGSDSDKNRRVEVQWFTVE
jgi:NitT/TauT family transport system substrate-binding protein